MTRASTTQAAARVDDAVQDTAHHRTRGEKVALGTALGQLEAVVKNRDCLVCMLGLDQA
jgi:hypothetical protein